MKRILSALTILISIANAQAYTDLGVGIGYSYYLGDINPSSVFYNENEKLSFQAILRTSPTQRWSYTLVGKYSQFSANDLNSENSFQLQRNLSFFNEIVSLSANIEFNFMPFEPFYNYSIFYEPKRFTPYLHLGLGGFYHNPKTVFEGNEYELRPLETEGESYSKYAIHIPFGFGFKYKLSERLLSSIHWTWNMTSTDYIDDVSTRYPNDPTEMSVLSRRLSDRSIEQIGNDGTNWGTQRGNSVNNDWFAGVFVNFSYILQKNPARCHFDQIDKKR